MSMFDKKQVEKNCLKFFNNDVLAATVWMSKYNLKNKKGEFVESGPEARFKTIAKEIIRVDSKYNDPIQLLEEEVFTKLYSRFLPGGSIISGIGNKH